MLNPSLQLTLAVELSMQCAVTLSPVTVWKPRLGGTQFVVDLFLELLCPRDSFLFFGGCDTEILVQ